MQIVIDIPKEIVEWINDYFDTIRILNGKKIGILVSAIKNGTPLPEGHGKLKDENEIFKCIQNRVKNLMNDTQFRKYRKDIDLLGTIPHIRNEVKTIIEADREVE